MIFSNNSDFGGHIVNENDVSVVISEGCGYIAPRRSFATSSPT